MMTVYYDHGDHTFRCDGKECRDKLETMTSNWDSALNVLRRNRWQARQSKATHNWEHFCPQHQQGRLPL